VVGSGIIKVVHYYCYLETHEGRKLLSINSLRRIASAGGLWDQVLSWAPNPRNPGSSPLRGDGPIFIKPDSLCHPTRSGLKRAIGSSQNSCATKVVHLGSAHPPRSDARCSESAGRRHTHGRQIHRDKPLTPGRS